jgi:hypothetical protein
MSLVHILADAAPIRDDSGGESDQQSFGRGGTHRMRYIVVDLEATCWENVRDFDRMETIERTKGDGHVF